MENAQGRVEEVPLHTSAFLRSPRFNAAAVALGSPIPEVRAGIEPANSGFADRCLTTWLPHRRTVKLFAQFSVLNPSRPTAGAVPERYRACRGAGAAALAYTRNPGVK